MNIFNAESRKNALKLWSNWLAVFAASAAAWAVENQAVILAWVETIEQPYRSVLTFFFVAAVPIFIRMLNQPGLHEETDKN
ncbi:hypothetical protein [Parasphingopyxis sp.]|uniref:hypothetical protein n=1 Tax=Parasphingopyxis sp. TaxID=1920299 RepID=UPI0026187638|nr:hypothetical protein [Parasphingopyxis sp.]